MPQRIIATILIALGLAAAGAGAAHASTPQTFYRGAAPLQPSIAAESPRGDVLPSHMGRRDRVTAPT